MQLCDFFKRRSFDRLGYWFVSLALFCLLVVMFMSAKNRYVEYLRRDRFGIYLQNIEALKPDLEKVELASLKLLDNMGKLRKQIPSNYSKSVATINHEPGIIYMFYCLLFALFVKFSTMLDFEQVCLRNLIVLLPTGFLY